MKPFNVFPYDANFDFMRLRWVSLAIAALLLLASIGAMIGQGFNFALDFTGGQVTEMRFARPVDVDAVRQRLAGAGFESAQVQTLGTNNELLIRVPAREVGGRDGAEVGEAVRRAASSGGNAGQILRSEFVGPQVGRELAINGVWALIFVIVGFLVYISFRFEKKLAVVATLTTLADVAIATGWFAISGREFDLTVLAGLLSALGYSINDKIVVFDRVRENFRSMRGDSISILNKSINQTLSRTVITSFVAFLTVLALWMYGGGSLKGMAEAQMIGIVIGTLSSIFVACPLLTIGWFKLGKQDLIPKARDEEALARRP